MMHLNKVQQLLPINFQDNYINENFVAETIKLKIVSKINILNDGCWELILFERNTCVYFVAIGLLLSLLFNIYLNC